MKFLLLVICLLTLACKNDKTNSISTKRSALDSIFNLENFDKTIAYSSHSCLLYKGKPLLTIGQNIKDIDPSLSFGADANGKYYTMSDIVTDYLSVDPFYTRSLSKGEIVGIVYFSADKRGRVFKVNFDLAINSDLLDKNEKATMDFLTNEYFSCLSPDLKEKKTDEVKHSDFIEKFDLYKSSDSADIEQGFKPHWTLNYSVILTKNGL